MAKFIKCDYCGEVSDPMDGLILPDGWMGIDKEDDGYQHFCSDDCLVDFYTVGKFNPVDAATRILKEGV